MQSLTGRMHLNIGAKIRENKREGLRGRTV